MLGIRMETLELTGDAKAEPMTPGEQENTQYLGCDEGQKLAILAILAVAAFHSLHTGNQFRTKKQAAHAICVSKQMFNVHEVDMTVSGVV